MWSIGGTRFTTETYNENLAWRRKKKFDGCIYGVMQPISDTIYTDSFVIVFEMINGIKAPCTMASRSCRRSRLTVSFQPSPTTARKRAASAPSPCGARRRSSARSAAPLRSTGGVWHGPSMLYRARRDSGICEHNRVSKQVQGVRRGRI